jgi:ABC-type nitrate/sulfonate/bicarbonate transport system permease component
MRKRRERIYTTWRHLFITFLVVGAPFLFLLIFSKVVHVAVGDFLAETGISFLRLAAAYFIAAALAWILAVSFYKGKRALFFLPLFDVLQSVPTFAALPLAVYFWGVSDFTVIFFLVLAVIWPIFFTIVSSLKLIKREWEEVTAIFGLRGFAYLRRFLLPVSIPGFITGSIIGLGDGWEALVATEIIVGLKNGLGGFFQSFSANPTITAFGIFGFLLFIFAINKLIWLPLLERSHRRMEE